jgi:hypothetical protein
MICVHQRSMYYSVEIFRLGRRPWTLRPSPLPAVIAKLGKQTPDGVEQESGVLMLVEAV